MRLLLEQALPSFAAELRSLLSAQGKHDLARQVDLLAIVDRCRCGGGFCASFYTQPKPDGTYGPDHFNIELQPDDGMIILDVVRGSIAFVEVLYRDDVRQTLLDVLP